jgi:hypothetical protein
MESVVSDACIQWSVCSLLAPVLFQPTKEDRCWWL